ncbi:protein tyrosine phosphatase, partial [Bracoviriform rubeculae]
IERICREHYTILNMKISGPCEECKKLKNIKKNRSQNIECWDNTRVCLKKQRSNYIHANYVDGFEQVRKFIVTQEPMDHTLEDYWSMVWQAGTRVIVMLHGADAPAVPSVSGYSELKGFTVTVKSIALQSDYVEMVMNVFNINTIRSRTVYCFKYLSWPKEGITDILKLISFIKVVNDRQEDYNKPGLISLPGPIVVYSTTGIGRAPTFCALDICMFQLVNSAIVSIPSVVFGIRRQRRSSLESIDHYVFINNVIVYFLATIPPN